MRGLAFAAIVCCGACNGIFGLDRTHLGSDGGLGTGDGQQVDAVAADANPDDTDGDGVPNERDDCPTVYNPGQADEDGDLIGNVCDNCPEVANPDQADVGETAVGLAADGIGDACDPNPSMPGDVRALFEPFNDPAEVAAHWTALIGVWNVSGGTFVQSDGTAVSSLAYFDQQFTDATVDVQATITSVPTTVAPAVGMWESLDATGVTTDGSYGDGYLCAVLESAPGVVDARFQRYLEGSVLEQVVAPFGAYVPVVGDQLSFYGALDQLTSQARCTPSVPGMAVGTSIDDPKFAPNGQVGLYTSNLSIAFRSVTVYTR